jgi:hypothetical protein
VFFGLRNYGSIRAVRKNLPKHLHNKINYQPCPTTMTALFEKNMFNDDRKNIENEIVISAAFNRFEDRYGNTYLKLFGELLEYCKYMTSNGYRISFCGHHVLDTHSKYGKFFAKMGFKIFPLYGHDENYIYNYYKNKKLVIGMRGHGLMIPFGLSVPIISLTSQNKQKWFIETTEHPEWHIGLDENLYEKLVDETFKILNNYNYTRSEIGRIQNKNKKITEKNIKYIAEHFARLVR